MTDRHGPFPGRELRPDQAAGERTVPVDPTAPRLGAPPDKFAMHSTPLLTGDRRQAVMLMLFPPEALRDQPLEVIEQVVFATGAGLLRGIAREIHQAFTSEPLGEAPVRNTVEALQGHLDAQRGRT